MPALRNRKNALVAKALRGAFAGVVSWPSHFGRLAPKMGGRYTIAIHPSAAENVRVFNTNTLLLFGRDHAGAEQPFRELARTLRQANWSKFQDVKSAYPPSRAIKGDRVVFNLKGNEYRVVAAMDYKRQAVFIKFVGTHADYDSINAETVNQY